MDLFLQSELKLKGIFGKKAESIDGCSTYFDQNKFELVQKFEVQYNFNMESELFNKDKLCLILVLRSLQFKNKLLLIGNTHINFNLNRGDIKIAEVKVMTEALSLLKHFYEE